MFDFAREKAELWKKADDLEYENLLKTSAMWIDDSNVTNCMACNSAFSLLLRKVGKEILLSKKYLSCSLKNALKFKIASLQNMLEGVLLLLL